MSDKLHDISNETIAQAEEDIRSWPWWVKLGIPIVGTGIVIGGIWSWVSGVFESNTRVLDASQMQVVNEAARATAEGFTESFEGRTEKGTLLTCSNSDSDPKGSPGYMRVTCTARVPVVKINTGADGKQTSLLTKVERNMDCTIPAPGKNTSGCKFKP